MTTLVVLAKAPLPGRVKTRLCPPYTPAQAACLAGAALHDTVDACLGTRHPCVLALDGAPPTWLPPAVTVVAQPEGGLDERLAAAFTAGGGGPVVLVGMDTPQVTSAQLDAAAHAPTDAVFGPAHDGGWWLLGLRRPDPGLLLGVPASTPRTGAIQRRRLTDAGLSITELGRLRDVDTARDAAEVARAAPWTRFARLLERLPPVGAVSR